MSDHSNASMQTKEGPTITVLHHRLTSCPKTLQTGTVPEHFLALIHDTIYNQNTQFNHQQLSPFTRNAEQCHWYTASTLITYFLADPSFSNAELASAPLLHLLEKTAQDLANAGNNATYINDVDRREEFIRVILNELGLRPMGETENQAEDRLHAVSSQERLKVLQASKAAEERAQEIRTALAKKRAKEAADKMTRE